MGGRRNDYMLFEAPDPAPLLEHATTSTARVSELESENRKMRQELEEFRTEAAHLKNQQATLRRLEERNRQLELQMEEKVKELVEMKQRNLAEENQKILEVLKERESSLQEQLRAAHDSVQSMQRLHEFGQSQLFELRAQSEEERAAKQAELTLLSDEVERAQSRLLSLEREKDHLRSQLQAAGSQEEELKTRQDMDTSNTLEASLDAKEKIISELHAELRNLESALSNQKNEHIAEIRKLNAYIHDKENTLQNLQKELAERPTSKQLDDLRKQVKILQAVGYNLIETEDWDAAAQGQEISKLESLLLDKNRKLEHELTQIKVQLSERKTAQDTAEGKSKELEAEVERQRRLISKLEEDILKGYNSTDRRANKIDDWDLSDSGITDLIEHGHNSQAAGNQFQEPNSMLEVICSQRDRFRQRLRESEEELRQTRDKNAVLLTELNKCKADNLKLYEKIRYIQDYTKERPLSRGTKKKIDDLEGGMVSDIESKYKKIYEDDINPFAAFSRKEKERKYKDLGIRDKITLLSGRFLLGNKYARTFVFFYSIGLHLLVFASLYKFSSVSYHNVTKDASFRTEMLKNASQLSSPDNPLQ
ncbi:protein CASP-like [Selaginella moellendorffii]|uniref:protein CASP-like n=1 Tax=Selaginella moellendorffii TaxID=88036 RepID=UPI000D1CB53D|nr:protein CASP-like [Selaginella moellendorffii]|eukprot:XP_024523570.1 protein CASP-like [Selaginella moellendorffii]